MTNEEIKKLADGYYAGNADWENKQQEDATKIGWRQGFGYALRQAKNIDVKHDVSGHLLSFFMWFRANGELHVDKSIEAMIEIYLKESNLH